MRFGVVDWAAIMTHASRASIVIVVFNSFKTGQSRLGFAHEFLENCVVDAGDAWR
jgi:hypothetical protein